MLIHYSISSFELLERKLSNEEKEEVYNVFYRVGIRMHLKELPVNYIEWTKSYNDHLINDLEESAFTIDLFKQYRKHLGPMRYFLLKEVQLMVCPDKVLHLLKSRHRSLLKPVIPIYKLSRLLKMDNLIKTSLLPSQYVKQVKEMDVVT
jgi:hypothetical protein